MRWVRIWLGAGGAGDGRRYMITPERNGFAPTLPEGRAQQPEPEPTKKPTQNSKSMLYAGIIPLARYYPPHCERNPVLDRYRIA